MSDSARSARARAHLAERDPALGLLSLWCLHRDHDGPTETQDETIRYAPGFDTLPLADQVGLVAHHVLHVALRHSARTGGMQRRLGDRFDAGLYGTVTDAIVNETLAVAGHPLPHPCVTLTGLLQAAGLQGGQGKAALAEWDTDRLYAAVQRDSKTANAARDYAQAQQFEVDVVAAGDADISPDEDAKWQAQMHRAAEAGEAAGTGIGPLLVSLLALMPPQIPWESELRRIVTRATLPVPKQSWSHPSRRWVAQAATSADVPFEPGRRAHTPAGRVVVAVDTSSSVTDDHMALFNAEVTGILRRSGAECVVLAFDEAVFFETLVTSHGGLPKLDMRRGGGTDFAPVFDKAVAFNPSILIVLSDLDAALPQAPSFDVLWVAPGGPHEVPFGRVLHVV